MTPFSPKTAKTSPAASANAISIARALATEAPILVLDEPTSALDAQNEQMITETLHSLKEGARSSS